MAKNGAIGLNNDIPWHISEDLKRFKSKTLNNTVLMGRKTFCSIVNRLGRPLPERLSLILTRDLVFAKRTQERFQNVHCFISLDSVLAWAMKKKFKKLFIIGGSEIYKQTLPLATELDITEIDANFEGDVFFPHFELQDWEISNKSWLFDEKSSLRFRFTTLKRLKFLEA
tara:strand:+ start:11420 stop:11929 length:510 start_codon:yes stop_codon:yes gene_type:complete